MHCRVPETLQAFQIDGDAGPVSQGRAKQVPILQYVVLDLGEFGVIQKVSAYDGAPSLCCLSTLFGCQYLTIKISVLDPSRPNDRSY